MNKQARYDQMYLDICERISHMSFAVRAKVGAILVKDDNIISMGWNGMPSGFNNNCEYQKPNCSFGNIITKPEALHAESNCISKVAKSSNSSLGATMYITMSPCMDCAKLIVQSGVSRVVYKKFYRDKKVLDFLLECGIIIESKEI
jgi:dCMP deaminase